MSLSPLILQLVDALRCLPGVGPKSAQRMAFNLLERNRDKGLVLSKAIAEAVERVGHCQQCRTLSELSLCQICANTKRDPSVLCVVETPADILAIEQTNAFRGQYFVLMGRLSPLDGIGPDELKLHELKDRIAASDIKELIIATNHTVEGGATAHYISEMVKAFDLKISRIAHGIPMGGELEYIDSGTLANALMSRREI
jgi:recombination protein RecR